MRQHWISLCVLLFAAIHVQAKPLLVEGNLERWEKVILQNETQYTPVMDMEQGVVIRAVSDGSASGYEYQGKINLKRTPVLRWQWSAEQTPETQKVLADGTRQTIKDFDETRVDGNDFVLRLIVSKKGFFQDVKAIHYVWSHSQPLEASWNINENNKVLVVGGGKQNPMQWQTVFRHIQKDWLALFDEKIDEIDSIILMTDSDHIQGQAIGYYGDMHTLAVQKMADNER